MSHLMEEFAKEVVQVNIEGEMKQSYLDYAMSVIVGRALPDVRDGLKPVHRRVLFAMNVLNNDWNRPYKKSARVVGDVIGKYHPHGDSAVYDALVRMAQSFSMRAMLIDGQGNFGSVDGDPPAAMRYTEIRMSRIAHELLADLDRETVDFVPNYDESESEPTVFPTRVPNLLVNGSSGIAVGMATNIPPHNLTEVVDASIAYLENPSIDIMGLMQYIPGPDFPTGAIISGGGGIRDAYQTGRGRIYVRARVEIEEEGESSNKARLIVSELPFQVNKARLLEKIAELAKEKKVEGISELRDESDKDGMRMVVELKRGEMPNVLLNKLYQYTQLQTVFGINMVALVDGQPRLLNLKQIIEAFIRHRREVVTRRTLFDLRKARARAHLLEGLAVALANIDPVIELIKTSANPAEARTRLLERGWPPGSVSEMLSRAGADATRPEDLEREFGLIDGVYHLSDRQVKAILDLQLHRLTGLEQEKILKEFDELVEKITDLLNILGDPERLRAEIRRELEEIKEQYGSARKTVLLEDAFSFNPEDFITPEDVMVTLSHAGYVKWQPIDDYAAQKRGGKGKTATRMKDEDFIDHLFVANTHDTVLCFSSRGKAYWLKVYEMPQASRVARGKPIINLLPLEAEERISAILPVADFMQPGFVLMATRNGTIKKTPLEDFSRPRSNGIIAIDLVPEDKLIGAAITDGARDVMLAGSDGKMIRFNETQVRAMGRTARGVRGIRIPGGHWVMSLIIVEEGLVLSATENGYGKCTQITEFRQQGRGGRGVISIQTSKRNGRVVASLLVKPSDEVMLITDGGKLVRTRVSEVSVVGRNTQGVRLMTLANGERLVGLDRLVDEVADEGADEE
jgi:DNA gyrase subunit A